jgi:hypothetical protein
MTSWDDRLCSHFVRLIDTTGKSVAADAATDEAKGKKPLLILKRLGAAKNFVMKATPTRGEMTILGFVYKDKDGQRCYRKTDEDDSKLRSVNGYRGVIKVIKADGTEKEWPCIERADGFVHLNPDGNPPSEISMYLRDGDKQIFVQGNILVHSAAYPDQIAGCIAPGTEIWEDFGVKNSATAMTEIIDWLGGWEVNRTARFEVKGYKDTAG